MIVSEAIPCHSCKRDHHKQGEQAAEDARMRDTSLHARSYTNMEDQRGTRNSVLSVLRCRSHIRGITTTCPTERQRYAPHQPYVLFDST